jgi:hypothetical protein
MRRLISGELTNYSVVRTSLEPLHLPLAASTSTPSIDIKTLTQAYSKAFEAAEASAKPGIPFSTSFEPAPWDTDLPLREPWHTYSPHPDGAEIDDRLWTWMYICDESCDYCLRIPAS